MYGNNALHDTAGMQIFEYIMNYWGAIQRHNYQFSPGGGGICEFCLLPKILIYSYTEGGQHSQKCSPYKQKGGVKEHHSAPGYAHDDTDTTVVLNTPHFSHKPIGTQNTGRYLTGNPPSSTLLTRRVYRIFPGGGAKLVNFSGPLWKGSEPDYFFLFFQNQILRWYLCISNVLFGYFGNN